MRNDDFSFTDTVTGLSSLELHLPKIAATFERQRVLGIIYIDISKYHVFEEVYGTEFLDQMLKRAADNLIDLEQSYKDYKFVVTLRAKHDDFILFCKPTTPAIIMTEEIIMSLSNKIQENLKNNIVSILPEKSLNIDFYMGYHMLNFIPNVKAERQIFRGIKEASILANDMQLMKESQLVRQLALVLRENQLNVLYQPIIDIQKNCTLGYEALLRGPVHTELESPKMLFDIAQKGNMIFDLEVLAKNKAIIILPKFRDNEKLFLNIEPEIVQDESLLKRFLAKCPIPPEKVVFEITERTAISDFHSFSKSTNMLKKLGFSLSIDDAGSGYASMESIAYIEPEYIKVDISIIRDVHLNYVKADIILTLLKLANKMGASMIAEGIEKQEEFDTLKQMGVHYIQGFLIGRPQKYLYYIEDHPLFQKDYLK